MKYILILTGSNDVTVDHAKPFIEQNGFGALRINSDKISNKNNFTVTSNPLKIIPMVNGQKYDVDQIQSIWYRKPNLWYVDFTKYSDEELSKMEYRRSEILQIMRSYMNYANSKNVFQVSNINSIRNSNDRLLQLQIAEELGFKIPNTFVSSNKKEIEDFVLDSKTNKIIKSFGPYAKSLNTKEKSYFTYQVNKPLLKDFLEKKEINHPMFFQEEVEKLFELRVTVIGKKVFACKINSQLTEKSSTDFRKINPSKIKHEEYDLPEDIKEKCLELCRRLNLQYGAIDFAYTKENEYVFFEINPNGQYYWLEELTGQPLSKAIADLLCYPDKYQLN